MKNESLYTITYQVIHRKALSLGHPIPHFLLEWKGDKTYGDYSTNIAFILAPLLKESPQQIAHSIAERIKEEHSDIFSSSEVAKGGFVNLSFADSFLEKQFIAQKKHSLSSFFEKKEKIIIEYSSPNIAKPMHVGHLRATLIGDFLARLHRQIGNSVIRWNHLGDWGTQFGKLLYAYKQWDEKKETISDLEKLYVQFHKKLKEDASLEEKARKEFLSLEGGDPENRSIWKKIVSLSLKEFQRTYALLSVSFDIVLGESFYERYIPKVFSLIEKSKKAILSEGALIVDLSEYNISPGLLKKSDGATLYLTRDLASLLYRSTRFSPDRILYVVGGEQSLHFKQLDLVAKKINLPHAPFSHIPFGTVLDENGKEFSTRAGRTVRARDLINEVLKRASLIIKEKKGSLSEKTSRSLGIAALKYGVLSYKRTSPVLFNPDVMLSFSGNSAPYIQYTYARAHALLTKAPLFWKLRKRTFSSSERHLMRFILEYPSVIQRCLEESSSQYLTEYLYALSKSFNTFYEKERILTDTDKNRMSGRLIVVKKASDVLTEGLSLLGIESPSVI